MREWSCFRSLRSLFSRSLFWLLFGLLLFWLVFSLLLRRVRRCFQPYRRCGCWIISRVMIVLTTVIFVIADLWVWGCGHTFVGSLARWSALEALDEPGYAWACLSPLVLSYTHSSSVVYPTLLHIWEKKLINSAYLYSVVIQIWIAFNYAFDNSPPPNETKLTWQVDDGNI